MGWGELISEGKKVLKHKKNDGGNDTTAADVAAAVLGNNPISDTAKILTKRNRVEEGRDPNGSLAKNLVALFGNMKEGEVRSYTDEKNRTVSVTKDKDGKDGTLSIAIKQKATLGFDVITYTADASGRLVSAKREEHHLEAKPTEISKTVTDQEDGNLRVRGGRNNRDQIKARSNDILDVLPDDLSLLKTERTFGQILQQASRPLADRSFGADQIASDGKPVTYGHNPLPKDQGMIDIQEVPSKDLDINGKPMSMSYSIHVLPSGAKYSSINYAFEGTVTPESNNKFSIKKLTGTMTEDQVKELISKLPVTPMGTNYAQTLDAALHGSYEDFTKKAAASLSKDPAVRQEQAKALAADINLYKKDGQDLSKHIKFLGVD